MCQISFKVDYTSASSIKTAIATYRHKTTLETGTYAISLTDIDNVITLPVSITTPGDCDLTITLTDQNNVTTSKATAFKIGNCGGIPNSLVLTNVANTSESNYDIYFTSDFALTNLYLEVSVDGVNWSNPLHLAGLTSPQKSIISLGGFKYVRISDVNLGVTTYSNVYHYVAASIVSMPSSQLISFSKTLTEVGNQGTASQDLSEALVYNGYSNLNGLAYGDIRIISLPDHGTLTVHGWDVVTPYTCPLSEIASNTLEFWPTGSDGSQPFAPFTTSFQYVVIDANGDESSVVTMNINFNNSSI